MKVILGEHNLKLFLPFVIIEPGILSCRTGSRSLSRAGTTRFRGTTACSATALFAQYKALKYGTRVSVKSRDRPRQVDASRVGECRARGIKSGYSLVLSRG